MTHWTKPLIKIFDSESFHLKSLAESVGADPTIFYINQDLSKCDLRGQDLRGMNLSGTNVSPSQMDEYTKIDPEYDPRFEYFGEYVSFRVPLELLALVHAFADDSKYSYKAWAFKNLIDWALLYSGAHERHEILSFIRSNSQFGSLIEPNRKPFRRVRLQIYRHLQEKAFRWAGETERKFNKSIYLELLLIGMLARKFRNINSKDYSSIVPLSMYGNAREHLALISGGSIAEVAHVSSS